MNSAFSLKDHHFNSEISLRDPVDSVSGYTDGLTTQ